MRNQMDAAAVERVTTTARERPGSPTARTGFADRAVAAQPKVPAWIAWMLDTAGEATTRFIYQCHYPLDRGSTTEDGVWGNAGKDSWIRNRALKAECAARGAFRAHLRGETGIFTANTPELPDDEAITVVPTDLPSAMFVSILESGCGEQRLMHTFTTQMTTPAGCRG